MLLRSLRDATEYPCTPATPEQLATFRASAATHRVAQSTVRQLTDLYSVANAYHYSTGMQFVSCDDVYLFEWSTEADPQLILGVCGSDIYRYVDGRFTIGDAGNRSFGESFEFATLVDLVARIVSEANDAG